jgi:hypothetical protein
MQFGITTKRDEMTPKYVFAAGEEIAITRRLDGSNLPPPKKADHWKAILKVEEALIPALPASMPTHLSGRDGRCWDGKEEGAPWLASKTEHLMI